MGASEAGSWTMLDRGGTPPGWEVDMAGALPGDSLGDLMRRRDALRQAAAVPDADAAALLEAVLLELDGAIEALSGGPGGPSGDDAGTGGGVDGVRAERR